MTSSCHRCGNNNPAAAAFCWYDGQPLGNQAGPVVVGQQSFPRPFVLPGDIPCGNFDDLARNLFHHWDDACRALKQGHLERFFGDLGRADLAQAAQEAARNPDPERGLNLLLERIPSPALAPPRLEAAAPTIDFGKLTPGLDQRFELVLHNRGQRLLCGSVVGIAPWLRPCDAAGKPTEQKLFQTRDVIRIPMMVVGSRLQAGMRPLEGEIAVDSNGGSITIQAHAEAPPAPFPVGPFAGSLTPRQLAEKALKAPKEAAPFFAKGQVAQWYRRNGWIYPVQGPTAEGVAAVQQYFEALGLARPPRVELRTRQLQFSIPQGDTLRKEIVLEAQDKKPIYAHAECAEPWVRIGPPQLQGTRATFAVDFDSRPAGTSGETVIRVFSNGNQKFEVPVRIDWTDRKPQAYDRVLLRCTCGKQQTVAVYREGTYPIHCGECGARLMDKGGHRPSSAPRRDIPPVPPTGPVPPAPAPIPVGAAAAPLPAWGHLLPLWALVLVLLGLLGKDLWSDPPEEGLGPVVVVKDEGPPLDPIKPKDNQPVFKVDVQDEPEERTGAIPVLFRIEDDPDERKALPPPPVKVEIKDEPGEEPGPAGGEVPIDPTPLVNILPHNSHGKFGVMTTGAAGAAANKRLTYSRDGATSNTVLRVDGRTISFGPGGRWNKRGFGFRPGEKFDDLWVLGGDAAGRGGLQVRQHLEVVPSKQPVMVGGKPRRFKDTVLATYVLANQDRFDRRVGIRFQVDTLIGGNDGVPFTVPGYPGLVNTFADFNRPDKVPDFIQALEFGNLANPGTVALMTLKVGGVVEPPGRVSLTCWRADGSNNYDVPVVPLAGDSAVILYWPDKVMKPGETRTVGFAYGLGAVSSVGARSKLGLVLGGSFEPGQSFTLTALLQNPTGGQRIFLELPEGLQLEAGAPSQPVPPPGTNDTSIVSWKAKVLRTGTFGIQVKTSDGLAQKKTVTILRPQGAGGGEFDLRLAGSFEPGGTFAVDAVVPAPEPSQTLRLELPAGLRRIEGDAVQPVRVVPGAKEGTASWKVQVVDVGRYPVRVASSTGLIRTKNLTIERPTQGVGDFRLALDGDFAPGKDFSVAAVVGRPLPGQKVKLVLPAGLKRLEGSEEQDVGAGTDVRAVWKVRVEDLGTHTVRVASTSGIARSKTLRIERPKDEPGRFTFDLHGDIQPGKVIEVKATVVDPAAGQTLKLHLTEEMSREEGPETRPVPPPASGRLSEVVWRVRILRTGRLVIRVESSTGVARSKTLLLREVGKSLF